MAAYNVIAVQLTVGLDSRVGQVSQPTNIGLVAFVSEEQHPFTVLSLIKATPSY